MRRYRLGSGGSQFVRYSADTWRGNAMIDRTLAYQGAATPGTFLGQEGGGYIPTYGESLQAQSLQVPAYTMRYGGGAAMGFVDLSQYYTPEVTSESAEALFGGPTPNAPTAAQKAEAQKILDRQTAHAVAENSSASYDWNNFTTGIMDIFRTGVEVGPEYIAALGKGTAAGAVQASAGDSHAAYILQTQVAPLLASLNAQQQQEVSIARQMWSQRFASDAGYPSAAPNIDKAGAFFTGQGSLDQNDLLMFGLLGLGALLLFQGRGGRRRA